jgi:hypothetical protein
MIVTTLNNGQLVTSGYIRFENGEVKLEFKDDRETEFYSEIGFGTRSFKPSDGLEYLRAVVAVFRFSTCTVLVKEKQDEEWMSMFTNTLNSTKKAAVYKADLNQRFWEYKRIHFPDQDDIFDASHPQDKGPPVFTKFGASNNIIFNPSGPSSEKEKLLSLISEHERHRWFRSMSSSQALAQSVLGNLAIHESLPCLADLKDDEGMDLFGRALFSSDNFLMEHKIDHLGERRRTSLDGFIDGDFQVAIECKFTEADVGNCSRPKLKKNASNYERDLCDGTYSRQRMRKGRCSLTEIGVLYWRYVPQLFNWNNDCDLSPCPLDRNYQLVRNILAVGVKPDGSVSVNNGLALLIYDERNPYFKEYGQGLMAFKETKEALREPNMLRKCSWQRLVQHLREKEVLPWLTKELGLKYGL